MTRLKIFTLVLLLSAAAFYPPPACAQDPGGAYVVFVGGQAVADEIFTTEKLAGGAIKTISVIGGTSLTTITKDNRPLEFWIETGGTKVLTTSFANGEAKILIAGQAEKSVPTDAVVVLENGVWSQFINLLAQYDAAKGGLQNFVGFLPSQSLTIPLTLEKIETRDFNLSGQTIPLTKFKLIHTRINLAVDILADKNGIPYLIEIPAQQVRVVKKGFEGLPEINNASISQTKTFAGEFTSEEVSFPNGEITLAGTLTVPINDKKQFPAIVLISGSGGQDRDGTALFNLYKQIAESLSQAGVAVLRVDDRGVGKSTILREKAAETSYNDLISDSRAAFDFLAARPNIDKTKIGFLGHSEGGETALTLASEDPRVAAIMLLAAASRPVDQSVLEQELYQRALRETVNASDKTQVMPIAQTLSKQFEAAKLPENSKEPKLAWFRQHLQSNPRQLAQKVKCPVLIVQGERDALVLAYHSVELAQALAAAGNKEVSLRILPNLTHIFTPMSEKPDEASRISEELLRTLQNWAAATLAK